LIKTAKRVYSVSELTAEIKDLLEYNFENIYITGEISNFSVPASGHYYFTLKDEKARIKAVMFRQTNIYMKFVPKDGMQIIARGRGAKAGF
jgi:exodeoxyribonuclease VII large subunit